MTSLICLPLQIKPLALRAVKVSEDEPVQELNRPHLSNSKEQLSEVRLRTQPLPFSTQSQAVHFKGQWSRPLRRDPENDQTLAMWTMRSEGSWCSSSCCSQYHLINPLGLLGRQHTDRKWLSRSSSITWLTWHYLKHGVVNVDMT